MITQIYLLFNKELNLISKSPYITGGNLKQGSDFELNILFDLSEFSEDEKIVYENSQLVLEFKCPGQTDYNLFPFISTYDPYVKEGSQVLSETVLNYKDEIIFEQDLTRYGIYKNKPYSRWNFSSVDTYEGNPILTQIDGNLQVQVTLLMPKNSRSLDNNYISKAGTAKVFIEKTLNYTNPYDVKQGDLERFLEDVKTNTENLARKTADELVPDKYVVDVTPNKDEYGINTEELVVNLVGKTETKKIIELPVPNVEKEAKLVYIDKRLTPKVIIEGTGKKNNPIKFNFNINKPEDGKDGKDGYGIHGFAIDKTTGNLIVYAEKSDDLSEENYEINENGELVIKL